MPTDQSIVETTLLVEEANEFIDENVINGSLQQQQQGTFNCIRRRRYQPKSKEAETFITLDITVVTNKQLLQIKKDFPNIIERLEKISDKYENILQLPINDKEAIQVINGIGMSYEKLNSSKMNFVDSVYKEYIQRELDKDYTTKHLNINKPCCSRSFKCCPRQT